MKSFETAFKKHLEENTVAAALGGSPGGSGIGPYDIEYAGGRHGDNRLPGGPGKKGRSMWKDPGAQGPSTKKKKKKKKKPSKGVKTLIPLQRRLTSQKDM